MPENEYNIETSGLTREIFQRIAVEYGHRWGAELYAVDMDGRVVFGTVACKGCSETACRSARVYAVQSTWRWGEATVAFCPGRRMIWAVPMTLNEKLVGGLVGSLAEAEAFENEAAGKLRDFRELCQALRMLAEQENVTNASLLEARRLHYIGEQDRAHAIHAFKSDRHNSLRKLYLREEPSLFAAIRSGDRRAAREIINRILVALHHHAGDRTDLLKSVFLELVVVMSRTAVEAGGNPEELLGSNFNTMAALSSLNSAEEISAWLVKSLEHLMDAIERGKQSDSGVLTSTALAYMEQNCGKDLHRDDVARMVGVSPSHFSFLIRRETGVTFTDLLNQLRIERAARLLRATDLPISELALKCGFNDQSYFTKVFKKYRRLTPLKYRGKSVSNT